jgi:hypothetical protein
LLNLSNLDSIKKNKNHSQKFINGNGKNDNDDNKVNNNNYQIPNKYNNYKKKKNEDYDNEKNNDTDNNDNILDTNNSNDKSNALKNKNIPKDKIANKLSLLTKEYFDKNDSLNKIDMIGNNVKDYLNYKKIIQKKII